MSPPCRLAISVSHPIQHFVSFYRALAAHPAIELQVIYGAPIGLKPYFDAEMQTEIAWNMDMTSDYPHCFLDPDKADVEPSFFNLNSPEIGGALNAFQPDAVIIYGYSQMNNLRALGWCIANRVPAMMIGDSELLQPRSGWKEAARRLILPRILGRFSAYLSVGDHNAAFYRSFGAPDDRIFRVPFTIDETAYRAASANREALRSERRASLGIPADAYVALFVGKLSTRKRPGDLLDAVAQLAHRDGRKVHALFAGNGEELARLQAQAIAENIPASFAGFVNVDVLPSLYAAADVLVHPSRADPHPLICSEAACIGLPMILSDRIGAAGPTDIARPGENAAIFPVGDVDRIATLLGELANDPARHEAMATASRAIFDECDMKASVDGVLAALKRVGVRA